MLTETGRQRLLGENEKTIPLGGGRSVTAGNARPSVSRTKIGLFSDGGNAAPCSAVGRGGSDSMSQSRHHPPADSPAEARHLRPSWRASPSRGVRTPAAAPQAARPASSSFFPPRRSPLAVRQPVWPLPRRPIILLVKHRPQPPAYPRPQARPDQHHEAHRAHTHPAQPAPRGYLRSNPARAGRRPAQRQDAARPPAGGPSRSNTR